jgi:RecB family exonuclease
MRLVVSSKRGVSVVVPMAGDDGEPLTPSRLTMQGQRGAGLAEGVLAMFDDRPGATPAAVPRLVTGGGRSRFLIPRPVGAWDPSRSLRVGDFRLFLEDPYRFYVQRVLGLSTVQRRAARELDPLSFGNLLHAAVGVLVLPELCRCVDVDRLRESMLAVLRREAGRRYGRQPATAVRAQLQMLAGRLAVLAERQAELAASGWRVAMQEVDVAWSVPVPEAVRDRVGGVPGVTITGRIDRVDVHDADRRVRVIDYKTGERGDPPQKTHRDAAGAWVDLQLPLYAEAAARGAWRDEAGRPMAVELPSIAGPADVELGYVVVPRSEGQIGWRRAGRASRKTVVPWGAEELASAYARRDAVLAEMLTGGEAFWPRALPGDRGDAVSAMASVKASDRGALLAASRAGEGVDG